LNCAAAGVGATKYDEAINAAAAMDVLNMAFSEDGVR
jgi:hypothetical protein